MGVGGRDALMPFLFPALLSLAGLAAVPILIHLLNRRRYKRVPWAAMKFLRDALREEARRIQYKDLLLMLLRALVCVLLALAIARPITRMLDADVAGKRGVVFVVDRSASMGLSTGTEKVMDMARREAISVLREMPPGTLVGLVDASRPAATVIPRTRDLREVEKAIEEMEPTDAGTDVAGALRLSADLFRDMERTAGRDLFFFSDMQASAWRSDAEGLRKAVSGLGPGTKCYAIPVGAGDSRNLAVTVLRPDPSVVPAQQPFAVDAEVLNGGGEPEANVVVELRIDGNRAGSAVIPRLEPGHSARVRLLTEIAAPGNRVLEAVVGQGRERFNADDVRRTVVRVVQGAQVLLVDGQPGARFGEGAADYLDAVFAPETDGDTAGPFLVTRMAAPAVAPKDFADKDLVVLCNLNGIRPDLILPLRSAVERGAGLAIFLGASAVPAAYNALAVGTGDREAFLPAAVGKTLVAAPAEGSDAPAEVIHLSAERLEHEWMSFFRPRENRPILRVPVRQALALTVATGAVSRVVAWYEKGQPAIVEKKLGLGRVVLVGTTADPAWNSLFQEPLGPILVSRMASAILPGNPAGRTALVGERVQLPIPAGERKMSMQLAIPGNKILTAQPELIGDQPFLVHGGQGRSGVYRFQIASIPPREEVFVLNVPADESDIRPLPAGDLKSLFPAGEFTTLSEHGADAAGRALRQARLGTELWWPVLLCAFLLLVIEITFARLITAEAPSIEDVPRQARIGRHRGPVGAAAARGRADA